MNRASPTMTQETSRLAVLRAELEDLDHVLGTPGDKPLPASPRVAPERNRAAPSLVVKPMRGDDKRSLLDNYEHVLAESAHVRRQVHYLSKEVATIAGRKTPTHAQPSSPTAALSFDDDSRIDYDVVRRRVDARLGSQSPTPVTPLKKHPQGQRAMSPTVDAILLDEVKQREAEASHFEKQLVHAKKKMVHDNDSIRQAVMLLRHSLSTAATCGDHALASQNVIDILEELKGDDVMPAFDDRLGQRIDDHEQAKVRILESRKLLETATPEEREARFFDVITRHELAAVAADSVKKQHTKKVMTLTKQLCDQQAQLARTEDVVNQKNEQLKAAHEALAHTGAQLAAVTDTTKELSRIQEEKQDLTNQLHVFKNDTSNKEKKIKVLEQELEVNKHTADELRMVGLKNKDLNEVNAGMLQELNQLRQLAQEQEAQIMQLQEQYNINTRDLEESLKQTDELQQMHSMTLSQRDQTMQRAHEDSTNLSAANNNLRAMENELSASEQRVAKLTEQLQASVDEVKEVSCSMKEMSAAHDTKNLELATANTTIEALRSENASLRESVKSEQAEKIRCQRDNAALSDRIKTLTSENDDLTQRFREKESLEAIQQEDLFRKDTQAEVLVKQLREKTEEVVKKERELNTKDIETKKRLATLDEREAALQNMEREIIARRSELGHSMVNNTITNSKIAEMTQLAEAREAECAELRCSNAVLQEKMRTLEIDREEEINNKIQLEQVIEMVRNQLQDNTTQFAALTEDLQVTRQRLDTELAQRDIFEEQLRSSSDSNANLQLQNKNLEAEAMRLLSANEALEAGNQYKNEALMQTKQVHDSEMTEMHRQLAESNALAEQMRHQEMLAQRNERRAEECRKESNAATDIIKDIQKELVHKQAQSDDAMRNASNLWSAIARLGRKFDEYEKMMLQGNKCNKAVHEKFEDASSFLRYIRGWWSMYKDKDPSQGEGPLRSVTVASTSRMMSPGRLGREVSMDMLEH